jgi:hypothetical protein
VVAVNVPIVVATGRALARGWQPLGDNGFLLVRVRDVGTSHNPLLGSWTSASLVVGEELNNPGPLYFDVVAPAVRLLGPWVGLAVGVMLVNMAASTLAVVAARRISGAESMIAVALARTSSSLPRLVPSDSTRYRSGSGSASLASRAAVSSVDPSSTARMRAPVASASASIWVRSSRRVSS